MSDQSPQLQAETVEKLQTAIERALGVVLTDEQRNLFAETVAAEWAGGESVRKDLLEAVQMFTQVSAQIGALPHPKQAIAWREFGRQLYAYAEQKGQDSPVGRLIIDSYKAKNDLLVAGDPPLSRQAAESYIEMNTFFHAVITRSAPSLDKERKTEMVELLRQNFPGYSRDLKEQISQADTLWGILRYNYRQASRDERERFRQELLKELKTEPAQGQESSEVSPEALSSNSSFQRAVQRLRLSARQGTPFRLKNR